MLRAAAIDFRSRNLFFDDSFVTAWTEMLLWHRHGPSNLALLRDTA
jgi:hypothetical protein